MNVSPDKGIINDIAVEMGVHPSFVEKDYYAVQLLQLIASLHEPSITPIFSGGTSLSKGYGLIKRFSEDLDFKIKTEVPLKRAEYKLYRNKVIETIKAHEHFEVDTANIIKQDQSRFFGCRIAYPQQFSPDTALRNEIKLEMRFQKVPLAPQLQSISSFIALFTQQQPETAINCISPVETAADKVSALMWRINIKDRTKSQDSPQNDPTIMRHLHDLCALQIEVRYNKAFYQCCMNAFSEDRGRNGSDTGATFQEMAVNTLRALDEDPEYHKEYTQFVDSMSYAKIDEHIDFHQAKQSFAKMVGWMQSVN